MGECCDQQEQLQELVRLTKSGKKQGKILLQLKSSSLGSSSNLANEEDAKGPVEVLRNHVLSGKLPDQSIWGRQLQKSGAELSGQSNDEEHTLRGDSPTHESMSTPIDIYGSPGEGMHEVESRTPRVNGKGPLADGDAANKSSSALATTASTCQVPGGTSLLVGCVLGKCASRTEKQQIKGPPDWKLSDPKDKRLENAELREFKWTAEKNEQSDNQVLLPTVLPPVVTDNLSGSTMIYLFKKVASVTDCRRTGHFVLPKRKVEEHFPPLVEPAGVWISFLDEFGKEWSFEFCFWHSKDSRIYYLKKFFPFVQSANIRGGDTVYFSRLEPEGTLCVSYRKQKPAATSKYVNGADICTNNLRMISSSNEVIQDLVNNGKSALDEVALRGDLPQQPALMEINAADLENFTGRVFSKKKQRVDSPSLAYQSKVIDLLGVGKVLRGKKGAVIRAALPQVLHRVNTISGSLGPRRKRLWMELEEYIDWEGWQNLLQAPPGAVPTIVSVEGHDFEEYTDPPVLMKRAFSISNLLREGDQWVRCNNCGIWRRLPSGSLTSATCICSDSARDPKRSHCSASQGLCNDELDGLLGLFSDTEGRTDSDHEDCVEDEICTPRVPNSAFDEECCDDKAVLSSKASASVEVHSLEDETLDLSENSKFHTSEKVSPKDLPASSLHLPGLKEDSTPYDPSSLTVIKSAGYDTISPAKVPGGSSQVCGLKLDSIPLEPSAVLSAKKSKLEYGVHARNSSGSAPRSSLQPFRLKQVYSPSEASAVLSNSNLNLDSNLLTDQKTPPQNASGSNLQSVGLRLHSTTYGVSAVLSTKEFDFNSKGSISEKISPRSVPETSLQLSLSKESPPLVLSSKSKLDSSCHVSKKILPMIVEGTSLQSSCFKQDSFPQEPSAVLAMKKLSYVRNGAGKGHQLCTGCDTSIGSAAQGCKKCGRLTDYGIRKRAQLTEMCQGAKTPPSQGYMECLAAIFDYHQLAQQ